jgi:antitoxin (DNA-binding transcriptional repressor) of toxin-antitoxin stability system
MMTQAVSVTEFSRGLSEFLNRVQYRGQALDIQRGKRVIARVLPATASDGFPLNQLDDFLIRGPQLEASDRELMASDVQAVRSSLVNRADPWAL